LRAGRRAQRSAAERANYQLFLSELPAGDVLDAPRPEPMTPDEASNAYVFEKSVPLIHGVTGRIDLYRRGCFVSEQAAKVRAALAELCRQVTAEKVAGAFDAAAAPRLGEWLAALAALGQARVGDEGQYVTV
jgi:hypothetical protein